MRLSTWMLPIRYRYQSLYKLRHTTTLYHLVGHSAISISSTSYLKNFFFPIWRVRKRSKKKIYILDLEVCDWEWKASVELRGYWSYSDWILRVTAYMWSLEKGINQMTLGDSVFTYTSSMLKSRSNGSLPNRYIPTLSISPPLSLSPLW